MTGEGDPDGDAGPIGESSEGEDRTEEEHIALPRRTNHPYDAPTPPELIEVVARYLRDDLLGRVEGHDRWTLRVAANALMIASREITSSPIHLPRHDERLTSLGFDSDRTLSEAIRSGGLDERWDEVVEVVFANVCDGLSVANPTYAITDEEPPPNSTE
ncbi:MAG: DUF6285 domain-containing protein [Acidimicrobiales bacterium]